jgi:hypothetical protein
VDISTWKKAVHQERWAKGISQENFRAFEHSAETVTKYSQIVTERTLAGFDREV